MTETEMVETKDEAKATEGVLYLGIDLGTSRTSVCSSNGVRSTVESFVGYPKDAISMKLLKRSVLFGEDARKHRLSLNLYRPLEHGVLKFNKDGGEEDDGNLKAAQDLIREIPGPGKPMFPWTNAWPAA
jgi:rod shape-determining protein MreB